MARLVHLSDLHFGAHDEDLVEAVERKADELKPDLIVISGDFTQRARTEQFKEACRFLERLREAGHEVLGVPGNHDVPLYDVLRRFLSPLTRYRRFIDETLVSRSSKSTAWRCSASTPPARSLSRTGGSAKSNSSSSVRRLHGPIRTRRGCWSRIIRCLPFPWASSWSAPSAGTSSRSTAIEEAGVDLLLAGHAHHASVHSAADLVTRAGGALVIQAGTATSTRVREQNQSFNVIDIENGDVTLTVECWCGDRLRAERRTEVRMSRGPLAHP